MHENVTTLTLHFPDNQTATQAVPPLPTFLHDITNRMPLLTTIQLETDTTPSALSSQYARCIPKLPRLCTFRVKTYLDGEVFNKLAQLPHLQYIYAVYTNNQPGQT
jgi:hypothetical protein